MIEIEIDPGPRARHHAEVRVVAVVVVMVVVMVEVRRLDGTGPGTAAVLPVLVLEVLHATVVALYLVAQNGVLLGRALLVVLEAPDAVEALEVDPAAPRHAHAVHYQVGLQVDLRAFKIGGLWLVTMKVYGRDGAVVTRKWRLCSLDKIFNIGKIKFTYYVFFRFCISVDMIHF